MYICGTKWCQVSVDEPGPVVAGLYVREQAGLLDLAAPELPALEPPSQVWLPWARHPPVGWGPPQLAVPADDRTAEEWERWWWRLVRAQPERQHPADLPDFRSVQDLPGLRAALRVHGESAVRWTEAVQDDPRARVSLDSPRRGLTAMLDDLMVDGARPFKLRLTVVPLAVEHAWVLDGAHVLLTRRLIGDPENLLDWLRPRILGLARGRALTG